MKNSAYLLILSFNLIIAGCSDSSNSEFNVKYKDKFVSSCNIAGGDGPMKKICECQADKVLENFSPKETTDSNKIQKYLASTAQKCIKEVLK